MDINDFFERMDHEFIRDPSVSVAKKGYRLDNKGRGKNTKFGIKSQCKCDTYNTADYITSEIKEGKEILCFVEYSDLDLQYSAIAAKIKLLESARHEGENITEWLKLRCEIIKNLQREIHHEIKCKIEETRIFLTNETNHVTNKPNYFNEKPQPVIVYNIEGSINRSPEAARMLANLVSNVHTALTHGKFRKPVVTDIKRYCSTDFVVSG